jgi:Tfp pilus assembly protein PilF
MTTASAHAPSPNASFDELVRYAEDRFLQMDLEEAEQYYRLALKKQPKNTEIMDIIGEILVEKNNIEAAKQVSYFVFSRHKSQIRSNSRESNFLTFFTFFFLFSVLLV